jgi:hypothetical protein
MFFLSFDIPKTYKRLKTHVIRPLSQSKQMLSLFLSFVTIQVEVNNLAKLATVTIQECFRYVQAGLRTIVTLCEQA